MSISYTKVHPYIDIGDCEIMKVIRQFCRDGKDSNFRFEFEILEDVQLMVVTNTIEVIWWIIRWLTSRYYS